MSNCNLVYAAKAGKISFRTDTGFALENGVCALHTARGELRPDFRRAGVAKGARHEFHIRRLADGALEFWQSVQNLQPVPLDITAISMFGGVLCPEGSGWQVAHTELFQDERYFGDFSFFTGGLFAPLPGTEGEFGMAENLPFPGMVFTHPERGTVLMGVLSQERCKPCWTLRQSGRQTFLRAEDRFTGVPRIRVGEGQALETERWVILFTRGGFEDVVDEYYSLLRRRVRFYGADSILRRAVLWGSWNYNFRPRGHMDVTHDVVAANARALSKLAPDKPRFVMIDDGYQRDRAHLATGNWFASCLELFHPDGQPPHDQIFFPRGMKGAAEAIRKGGAQPAIWTTPRVLRNSSLVAARPDLFLKAFDKIDARTAYLDYSIPEAREYTRRAWHTICQEWGYKGIKMDFWSLPYEIPQVQFKNQDRTAIELRNLFLQDLRECIPAGGYILTGCVVNAGNPFPGRYVDAARMGYDIGNGTWANIWLSAAYLTASIPFSRHDCLLADPDSIGWYPKNTLEENRLWATMALLSGSVCEIAGDLARQPAGGRELLRRAIGLFKPARRTVNCITEPGINRLPAGHIILERDDGVYEAHLNWMPFSRAVNLPKTIRDLWSGRRLSGRYHIPPHGVVFFKRS